MNSKRSFILGVVCGAVLFGGIAGIAASDIPARLTSQIFYLKDKRVELEAYSIYDHNYVKLRDVAALVNFSVEYNEAQDSVTIDADKPYVPESAPPASGDTQATDEMNRVYDRYYTSETSYAWTNGNSFPLNTITDTDISLKDKFAQNYSAIKAAIEKYIPENITDGQEILRRALVCVSQHLVYNNGLVIHNADGKEIGVKDGYAVDFIDALLTEKPYPTTCGGYAAALSFVCAFTDLPCVTVHGSTPQGNHAWNAVYLNGEWRQINNPSNMQLTLDDRLLIGSIGYYDGKYQALADLPPEVTANIPSYDKEEDDDRITVIFSYEPNSAGRLLWSSAMTDTYSDLYPAYTAAAERSLVPGTNK